MGKRWIKLAALALVGLLVVVGLVGCRKPRTDETEGPGRIVVGGKTFSEQFLLAEMLGILIEENTDLEVDVKTGLGTKVLFDAIRADEVDLYVEYTGTGLMAILDMDLITDPDKVYETVKKEYDERFNIKWLKPLGFNNTYAMVMRRDKAQELGLTTISDLAEIADQLVLGSTHEFAERTDGAPGLQEHYGFQFKEVKTMDPALMYQAVAQGSVDVISGFSTEGRIPAYDLVVLEDDKQFFPPYHAAPIIRGDVLEKYPELGDLLNQLAGRLDDQKMASLNAQIDVEKREPADVAREFLEQEGLI